MQDGNGVLIERDCWEHGHFCPRMAQKSHCGQSHSGLFAFLIGHPKGLELKALILTLQNKVQQLSSSGQSTRWRFET